METYPSASSLTKGQMGIIINNSSCSPINYYNHYYYNNCTVQVHPDQPPNATPPFTPTPPTYCPLLLFGD